MSEQVKIMIMGEAVSRYVKDGCTISQCGLIMREPLAACHEIIRQGRKNSPVSAVAPRRPTC
ncbi:MAG: hypothetical protein ACOY40_01585 [Bacillota bacterium]